MKREEKIGKEGKSNIKIMTSIAFNNLMLIIFIISYAYSAAILCNCGKVMGFYINGLIYGLINS